MSFCMIFSYVILGWDENIVYFFNWEKNPWFFVLLTTHNLFLQETVINLNGSVSYIFLNFGWFSFLIFPISYGLRFLNFQNIFSKSQNSYVSQINIDIFYDYILDIACFEFVFIQITSLLGSLWIFFDGYWFLSCWQERLFLMFENSKGHCFLWLKNLMGRFL